MSISALIYGGHRITSITPPNPEALYSGVFVAFNGTTFENGRWTPASVSFEMSPHEAIDLALRLIKASDEHGVKTQNKVLEVKRRLFKSLKGKP